MSFVSKNPLLMAYAEQAAGGYSISRSLRFNSSDSAYLSRTPASAGNRKTWSFSCWVKRGTIGGSYQNILSAANSVSDRYEVYFDTSTNQLTGEIRIGGTGYIITTTQVFRDPSAWYHILVVMDTSQATASNRHKFYVNGTQVTNFASASYPNQDATPQWNAADPHSIGRYQNGASQYLDGYLADIYFIDGQALDPSSFTETDATTGQLIPKAYTGSYNVGSGAVNGFHLEFADNSSNTATTLGKDTSGNSNNWTPNNLSVTAGAGNDSLVDVPTNGAQTDTGVGGEVRGNYCTLNPLQKASYITLSNGNLDFSTTYNSAKVLGTIAMTSGKWYWEAGRSSGIYGMMGIALGRSSINSYVGGDVDSWAYASANGQKYNNGNGSSYGASYTNGDVIGVAFDADAGTLTFYKNGSSQGTAFTGLTSGPYFPAIGDYDMVGTINFGQRQFAYASPAGFKALCTANLPAPLVTKPNTVMDVVTYTGTGSAQTISGLNFSPDLVWVKSRSNAEPHILFDAVRGVPYALSTSDGGGTAAEFSEAIASFNSDGWSYTSASSAALKSSGYTYAAWTWDAGSSTVTNTAGSITSSVRANATAGFSVVTWSKSPAGAHTVGHGIGVAPQLVIVKSRSSASEWAVYHSALGATKFLKLNTTDAAGTVSAYWNDTAPTSTTISLGSWSNLAGDNVAYCFAPVAGFSAFGSYTGNGSTDGPFVYTGFRPRWVMIKRTDTTNYWIIQDAARNTFNVVNLKLAANTSNAENDLATIGDTSQNTLDFLSNGFKCRTSNAGTNTSSGTYVYMAFAESPFALARAR
jgi:hypothetical protein